jgi:hypothetical protein
VKRRVRCHPIAVAHDVPEIDHPGDRTAKAAKSTKGWWLLFVTVVSFVVDP